MQQHNNMTFQKSVSARQALPEPKSVLLTKRGFLGLSLGCGVGVTDCLGFSSLAWAGASTSSAAELVNKPWLRLDLPTPAPHLESWLHSGATSSTGDRIGNPVDRLVHWTRLALSLVVKYQQNPLRASRVLAYLHVGLNDAWMHVVLSNRTSESKSSYPICAEIAAHRAAYLLLEHFYPHETPGQFAAQFAAIESSGPIPAAPFRQWAYKVANEIAQSLINRSLRDGAGRVWPVKNRPEEFPGIWQATFPLYAVNPTEGFAGDWLPWVELGSPRYNPPMALRPGDVQYQRETLEVLETFNGLSASQKLSAQRWNLDAGSVTPAGVWAGICLEQLGETMKGASAGALSSHEQSAFALSVLSCVCVAMHDALIACWRIKFRDWSERPITAIRRTLDPNFVPLLVTPGFPSYVSGHATLSAAAAGVLAGFWPERGKKFQAMAQDAADSRLWGGIHFRSDNEEGLKLGASIGNEVLTTRRVINAKTSPQV